jgi:glutamate--cysteine ligase
MPWLASAVASKKKACACCPRAIWPSRRTRLALGSALTHPHITTDYSESQMELITGAHLGVQQCLDELTEVHQFVHRTLHEQGGEMLWVSSMPCGLPTDETIPLARYGSSNVGRAKSVYRMGLGHRYGRRMQTISGIHYNWSLPA